MSERAIVFDATAFKWLLPDRLDLAEGQRQALRSRTVVERLQNVLFDAYVEWHSDFEEELLQKLQVCAARLVAPKNSEA